MRAYCMFLCTVLFKGAEECVHLDYVDMLKEHHCVGGCIRSVSVQVLLFFSAARAKLMSWSICLPHCMAVFPVAVSQGNLIHLCVRAVKDQLSTHKKLPGTSTARKHQVSC